MDFATFHSWFDERFSTVLKEKINQFSAHSESAVVARIARYAAVLGKDGKRFRPYLIFIASGFDQDDVKKHFALFAAVELIHLFALIHDDIMDNATVRHGVPCAHEAFKDEFGIETAKSLAILLGDIVFAWGYECLIEYTTTFPQYREALLHEFNLLVSEVTHGQMLDVISPEKEMLSRELLVQKMTLKTARYSFVQPLKLGFIVAGSIEHQALFADTFGTALGITFQLQDDLLDIAPLEQSGKSPFVDIQAGQQTLLSWYILTEAEDQYKQRFTSFFGKVVSIIDQRELMDLLVDSGARAYVETLAKEYLIKAQASVTGFHSNDSKKWDTVITLIAERKK